MPTVGRRSPATSRACPSTRTTGSSTTWTEDRSECHNLAAEHARQGGRAGRPVVERGRGVRGPPARRPHHRAVLHPVPGPVAAPHQPPLHLLPPDVAAPRPGRSVPRRARLGHDRHHRPAGGCGRGAVRLGQRRTRGSACSSRTTAWSSTTTASGTTTWRCPRHPYRWVRRWSGSGSPLRQGRARPTLVIDGRPSGILGGAVRHDHDLQRRARASGTTTGRRSASGTAARSPSKGPSGDWRSRWPGRRPPPGTPRPRRPSGRRCPASDRGAGRPSGLISR